MSTKLDQSETECEKLTRIWKEGFAEKNSCPQYLAAGRERREEGVKPNLVKFQDAVHSSDNHTSLCDGKYLERICQGERMTFTGYFRASNVNFKILFF